MNNGLAAYMCFICVLLGFGLGIVFGATMRNRSWENKAIAVGAAVLVQPEKTSRKNEFKWIAELEDEK